MMERHLVKYFAPGWFALVMGTGSLGNILFLWQETFAPGRILGMTLAGMADLCFCFFVIPWTLRWIYYSLHVQRDLEHPITRNFFVTMPGAIIIFGTNIYTVWSQFLSPDVLYNLCFLFWITSLIGVAIFTFYITFAMMRDEKAPKPEVTNFSWLMPSIANMAVPLIGNPVLNMMIANNSEWAGAVMVLNLANLGIGFFLFIFIGSIIFGRLAQHALPPTETAPTFGILLSAVGLAVNAIIDTSKNAQAMGFLSSIDFSHLFAVVIWGFGIWTVGITIIICLFCLRQKGIPFSLGWWAFIFPLAAYVVASQKVTAWLPTLLTSAYTLLLTLLLASLWLYTFINTVRAVIDGRLFSGLSVAAPSVSAKDRSLQEEKRALANQMQQN